VPNGISQRKIHVAIVDDDEDMHLLVRETVSATEEFSFAGGFSNTTKALAELPCLDPDVVLMDIRMPGIDGIEFTKRLKQVLPRMKIIIVTSAHDSRSIDDAFRAGADRYIIKPLKPEQCLATLKFALVPQRKRKRLKRLNESATILTPRERDVMSLLAQGFLYKEIADALGKSYSAVHKHQHNIFKKLRVNNRSEAIRKWLEAGESD
jgi:DNA-binding NarL/FixJ family response regulator